MKSKKLFSLLLVGVTALGATSSVYAKEVTYKNISVIKVQKPSNCFPNIQLPEVDCPEVELPEVDCPEVELPEVDCPDVEIPGVEVPDVEVPDVEVPDVEVPDVEVPDVEVPDVEVPDVEVPDVEKPGTETPDTEKPGTEAPEVSTQAAYENKVLELVNVERAKYGLSPLQMDESVRNVARMKSSDMRKNNYFDHNSPTYGSPFDMLKQFGISYKSAGENIAQGYPTPEAVVKGWMNSPGHRANILNSSFTHIGIGYDAQGHYWTQMFIGK